MFIVFDLDFTLWDCGGTWCDCTSPPYYKQNGMIRDSGGKKITLYSDVHSILNKLKLLQVPMAIASRTTTPDWADELMRLFDIKKYFDYFEIYPASKLNHFKSLQHKTNIPFGDMVFFDDEERNIKEVGRLGVDAIFVGNGMNLELIEPYIKL